MGLHEYQVIGRKRPTEAHPEPPIYRMRIFAQDKVRARSRFWYYLSRNSKVKKTSGEILGVYRICQKGYKNKEVAKIRNFGIMVKYESRSGEHNVYKEFRDLTRNAAVAQMYMDMAARHRARFKSINVIEVKELADKECIRPNVKQFHADDLKFPLPHRIHRLPSRSLRRRFLAVKPSTYRK